MRKTWFQVLIVGLIVMLLQANVIKVFQIPSGSMEQTLHVGDRVLVNRLAYVQHPPVAGDIVVFERPEDWGPVKEQGPTRVVLGWLSEVTGIGPGSSEKLVKRIIGVPGDTVSCCSENGRLMINHEELQEPYAYDDYPLSAQTCLSSPQQRRCFGEIEVPAGKYLVMGDHRGDSSDSVSACRGLVIQDAPGCARFVSASDIVGSVSVVVYPLNRIGSPQDRPAGGLK